MTSRIEPHDRAEMTDAGGLSVSIRNLDYQPNGASSSILKIGELVIGKGEFVAVVGLNGAGKSTLLRIVSGDLAPKDRKVLKGEIKVGGQDVVGPINTIIDRVGVVHQNDQADLIRSLSIAQNVAIRQLLGGGHSPVFFATPPSWRRDIATRLGTTIPKFRHDISAEVATMSGGERQMLNVAIAVHLEHEKNPCGLLLLDEHTSSLDHVKANQVMQYTDQQIKETKTTAIMVTHRYDHAIRFADRILVVRNGEITDDIRKEISREELSRLVEGIA